MVCRTQIQFGAPFMFALTEKTSKFFQFTLHPKNGQPTIIINRHNHIVITFVTFINFFFSIIIIIGSIIVIICAITSSFVFFSPYSNKLYNFDTICLKPPRCLTLITSTLFPPASLPLSFNYCHNDHHRRYTTTVTTTRAVAIAEATTITAVVKATKQFLNFSPITSLPRRNIEQKKPKNLNLFFIQLIIEKRMHWDSRCTLKNTNCEAGRKARWTVYQSNIAIYYPVFFTHLSLLLNSWTFS